MKRRTMGKFNKGILGITRKFIKREYEKVGKSLGLAQMIVEISVKILKKIVVINIRVLITHSLIFIFLFL